MAFVVVEQCVSDETGRVFPLGEKAVIIGRVTLDNYPDISFNDDYISRQHAEICYQDGSYTLCDRGSANGTEIDGFRVKPHVPYKLKNNTRIAIGLVSGNPRAILCFKETPITIRAPRTNTTSDQPDCWLKIDETRKEVSVNNQVISLSKNEYSLLSLLFSRRGNVISKDEIIEKIWPEVNDPGLVSDASVDQMIYRLRKKIEPDPSKPQYIISKKGFGFMLCI